MLEFCVCYVINTVLVMVAGMFIRHMSVWTPFVMLCKATDNLIACVSFEADRTMRRFWERVDARLDRKVRSIRYF